MGIPPSASSHWRLKAINASWADLGMALAAATALAALLPLTTSEQLAACSRPVVNKWRGSATRLSTQSVGRVKATAWHSRGRCAAAHGM